MSKVSEVVELIRVKKFSNQYFVVKVRKRLIVTFFFGNGGEERELKDPSTKR